MRLMKFIFIGFAFICFLYLGIIGFADQLNCTKNTAGDVTCPDQNNPKVNYTTPSAATLKVAAAAQSTIAQQTLIAQQQTVLNNQAEQELIVNQIAHDPKLEEQQKAIDAQKKL